MYIQCRTSHLFKRCECVETVRGRRRTVEAPYDHNSEHAVGAVSSDRERCGSSNQTGKDPQHAGDEFAPHRDIEDGGSNVKKAVMKSEVGTSSS